MSGHLSQPDDWKLFPKKVIEQGIRVELEHTRSRTLARRIASDHLVEYPDYYTELAKMEQKLKKKWRKE